MEKTFKIRITICNMAEVFGLGLLSVAIGMLLYYNFFEPKQFNSYQLIMRGSLCTAIPFITLYLITLRKVRLEIKNEKLSFYRNNRLFYENSFRNLQKIIAKNNPSTGIRIVIFYFVDRKIELRSPVKLDLLFRNDDQLSDVFYFIIHESTFKRKRVFGRFLYLGKKIENKAIEEYWNPFYINHNFESLK